MNQAHPDKTSGVFDDTVGAFVPHGRFVIEGDQDGPLRGLSFAAKDLFDVAGHATGAGNPTWLATHPIPTQHNPVVAQLLQAGATLIGKTLTDELAYSIHGDNAHYGTPLNSAAPDRVPGGSSSGSVAAVAAGLCDFALGTDTGGSTRVPASYCGVWGLRTTHGLLPDSGMVPLNPSFDTTTWLARDAAVFSRVGAALLPQTGAASFARVLLPADALAQADLDFAPAVQQVFDVLALSMDAIHCNIAAVDGELEIWRQTYIGASAHEAWQVHGAWIDSQPQGAPLFGAAVAGRFEMARKTSDETAGAARARQALIREQVRSLLGSDGVAVMPSAASVAPLLDATPADIDDIRSRSFRITCIAGLCGLPQVSLPLRTPAGLPIGVSLLGPAGSDLALIRLAVAVWEQLQAEPQGQ
ncbi:amidase [Herbaspirillum lusitanum]|uniref:Amidase n=1 Tax=Herbaspirillum lusitanum TaxID=213312 RepID=A0ABW9A2W3_9BURK